jgi:soluble lytic murein transglycosylase-like protein
VLQSALQVLATNAAMGAGLDPALVCAIVEQESNWNPWAIRYEPAFEARYVPKGMTPTEATARAFSWGLMQIMGEVARENGYTGALPMLCDPATGLAEGIIHFKKKLAYANGDVTKALLMWNGGGNKDYPAQVLARVEKYK